MPKGSSKGYLNAPIANNTEIDREENANMINCILESFESPIPDLHNEKEVEQAIKNYLKRCISRGLRPGNLGLYNALGLDKSDVYDIIHGRNPKRASVGTVQLLKKACKHMSEYRELLGSAGKLNPATLIFWQKNFDGLEDVQRVDVAPINNLQAEKTPEELQQIAEQDIPIDAE